MFQVETRIGDWWENIWTVDDGSGEPVPETFQTKEEAEVELEAFFREEAEAVAAGDMFDLSDLEDFRIVPVGEVNA